ncbi:MAG TPA: hypothetical protein VEU08_18295 [Vicinamibacterales bacterium]|nr:hypothetical protein [Vicinamibacterales bacterium]
MAAFGAVAAFLVSAEKQIRAKTLATAAFDVRARQASDSLADIRAAEQAYVVPGQGLPLWMHKVATSLESTHDAIAALRQSSGSADALAALVDADATLTEFETIDRRARDYMNGNQQLMASDVIFTEGAQSASNAARQVETARTAERQAADAAITDVRRREAIVVGAAAAFGLFMSFVLVPVPRQELAIGPSASVEVEEFARLVPPPQKPAAPAPAPARQPIRTTTPVLRAAADLAVALGRVNEAAELERLMQRTADVLDASGVIVWMGNSVGGDLRPVLVHGYSPQAISRMAKVPRTADNAAAAAYRTGEMQVVPSRPGFRGAVVAPILRADGCVGALSAEIEAGGENSEGVQAVASIVAAQLGCVLPEAPVESLNEVKTATA